MPRIGWGFHSEHDRRGPWPAGAYTPWAKQTTGKGRKLLWDKCSTGMSRLTCLTRTAGHAGSRHGLSKGKFTVLYNHHFYPVPKHFHPQKGNPVPIRKLLLILFRFAFSVNSRKGILQHMTCRPSLIEQVSRLYYYFVPFNV